MIKGTRFFSRRLLPLLLAAVMLLGHAAGADAAGAGRGAAAASA